MKVCLINTNREWGGGEKWHHLTALELVRRGFEVTIIAYPNSPFFKASSKFFRVLDFKIGNLAFLSPVVFFRLKKLFNREKFDAVILNLPRDVKVFSKPAFLSGAGKIVYRRGMNHPIRNTAVNVYFYENYVTHIIANSEDVKRSVCKYIPSLENRVTVIANGVDLDRSIIKTKVRPQKLFVGALGRLVDQKGHLDLINLGVLLSGSVVDFHIYIGGEGPNRALLESEIEKQGLEDRITLLGNTKPSDFFPLIDFFVFPSRFEGLSNAILESLQYGKPVFCYDVASNSEIIEHGKNGYLIEPYQVDQMARQVTELWQDPERYEEMQAHAQRVLASKFDSKKLYEKLENLLRSDSM